MYGDKYPTIIEDSHVAPGLAETIISSTCTNKVTTTEHGIFGSSMRYNDLKAEIDRNDPTVAYKTYLS